MSAIKPEPVGPGPATHRLKWIALGAAVVVAIASARGSQSFRVELDGPCGHQRGGADLGGRQGAAPGFTLKDQHGSR